MSKIELTPVNQVVYPWSLTNIDTEVREALTTSYKIIGDNIVIDDFNTLITFNTTHAFIRVTPGKAIQDSSLLELVNDEVLALDLSMLDATGILVGYIFFSDQDIEFKLGLTYLTSTGIGEWDNVKNKIVLGTYKFIKNTNNEVTSVYATQQNSILIGSDTYYIKGIHHNNINLSNMFNFLTRQTKYVSENYNAEFNDLIFADTSDHAFTIFLPQNPPLGSHITIIDTNGTFWEHSLLVDPNGSKINGISTHQFFRFAYSVTDFYYSGNQWIYNITRMWTVKGGTF